jgi:hypothetical protein
MTIFSFGRPWFQTCLCLIYVRFPLDGGESAVIGHSEAWNQRRVGGRLATEALNSILAIGFQCSGDEHLMREANGIPSLERSVEKDVRQWVIGWKDGILGFREEEEKEE